MIPICMTAGMFLKWFKDSFCELEAQRAEAEGRSVYALLDEIVAGVSPGAGGLTALPYLTGTLQPYNNPKARGVFFGVGLDTKKPQFIRAIFESVAFLLRENVELVEQVNGVRVEQIRSQGGGSKSEVWRRIKADVSGIPIGLLSETECASLGAAILAATAIGLYPSLEDAAARANGVSSWIQPDSGLKPLYDAGYAVYRSLYERLATLF